MKIVLPLIILLICSASIYSQVEISKENCLTNNEYDDRYASYSPNGERIVFESIRDGDWQVYLMDKKGNNVERLTNNDRINRRPTWHPKGKKILYESIKNGITELRTIRIKSRKETAIKSMLESGEFIFAVYSPDGNKIAVSLRKSENTSNIIVLNKRGKLIQEITNNDYRNYYPKWSKDGKELIYFSRKETANMDDEIYRINLETSEELRLTNWPKHNFCPSWSSDDRKIAYVTSMESVRPEIYIMNSDGSNKTRITSNEDGDTLPSWHPYESKILITGYRSGNYEICEIELIMN